MKPSGSGAVMADRARGEVAGDDDRAALYRKLEYFPTPPWAARAGGELIQDLDPGPHWAWEPACGEGHLAHGLTPYFERVYATDIHDYSTSTTPSCRLAGSLQSGPPLDFLSPAADRIDQVDWIVFNHPFTSGVEFVEAGLRRARRGVMALCRSGWLDTHGRWPFFFGDDGCAGERDSLLARSAGSPAATPIRSRACDLEAAFFDRVNMSLGRWEPSSTEKGGSTSTAYSWFVWFQDRARPDWLDDAAAMARARTGQHHILTRAIPPGTKARLTHPHDARDWGARKTTPLFGEEHDG